MRTRGRKFRLDKEQGKFLGVCAGVADYTGIDATIVRIGFVLATIAGGWPWTVIAYFAAAWLARPKRLSERVYSGSSRIADDDEHRDRMRSIDLRLQAIETYTASANSPLAREIEELR